MRTQTYEAALARAETVQQARAQQRAIERIGGRMIIGPPGANGMTLVRIILPEPYTPAEFLPNLPFFPV
jgi:hypothetical protein